MVSAVPLYRSCNRAFLFMGRAEGRRPNPGFDTKVSAIPSSDCFGFPFLI